MGLLFQELFVAVSILETEEMQLAIPGESLKAVRILC